MKNLPKNIIAIIIIGSMAFSLVSFASADTGSDQKTVPTIVQYQLGRNERNRARIEEFVKITGISTEDFTAAMKEGKTPLQVAMQYGISQEELKQRMANYRQNLINLISKQLSDEVASGQITKAQMEAKIKALEAHSAKDQGLHRRNFGFGN